MMGAGGSGGNRAEADRYLATAEKLLTGGDLHGAKNLAIRAQESDPTRVEPSERLIAVCDTLLRSQERIGSNSLPDWYLILRIVRFTHDPDLVANQYRRLAYLLNPNVNQLPYADHAYRLASDAWYVLSDLSRKAAYDRELQLSQLGQLGFQLHPHQQQQYQQEQEEYHHEQQQQYNQQQQIQQQQDQQQQQHNQFSQRPQEPLRHSSLLEERPNLNYVSESTRPTRVFEPSQPTWLFEQTQPARTFEPAQQTQPTTIFESARQVEPSPPTLPIVSPPQPTRPIVSPSPIRPVVSPPPVRPVVSTPQPRPAVPPAQSRAAVPPAQSRAAVPPAQSRPVVCSPPACPVMSPSPAGQVEPFPRSRQVEQPTSTRPVNPPPPARQVNPHPPSRSVMPAQPSHHLNPIESIPSKRTQPTPAQSLKPSQPFPSVSPSIPAPAQSVKPSQPFPSVSPSIPAPAQSVKPSQTFSSVSRSIPASAQSVKPSQPFPPVNPFAPAPQVRPPQATPVVEPITPVVEPFRPTPFTEPSPIPRSFNSNLPTHNSAPAPEQSTVPSGQTQTRQSAERNQPIHNVQPTKVSQVQSSTKSKESNFWTACPYCFVMYEYSKVYEDCTLRCQKCKRAFQALTIAPPPLTGKDTYFCCWGFFPLGISNNAKSESGPFPNWSPVSQLFPCSSQGGGNISFWKPHTTKVSKNTSPRVYYEDEDISDPSDVHTDTDDDDDDDWRYKENKKKKKKVKHGKGKGKGSVVRNGRKLRSEVVKRGNQNVGGGSSGEPMEQDSIASGSSSRRARVLGTSGRKRVRNGAKDLGKLDLNVEFSNEAEEPAAPDRSEETGSGNQAEDNIEGIGFFEGLDEFFSNLPILSAVADDKVKAVD